MRFRVIKKVTEIEDRQMTESSNSIAESERR